MAFTLLLIGMITVFVVLLLVVAVGNLLIFFVNKYLPSTHPKPDDSPLGTISHPKLAVLSAVVEQVTEGRGNITKIEKIN